MYKACIFDLDGTLADTIGSISHFANETIKKFGLAPFSPHDYQYFAGDGADDLIHRVLAASGCDTKEMFAKVFPLYRKSYLQDPLFSARPYDGILPLLDNLASAGAAMAVVSNKSDDTAQKVVAGLFGGPVPRGDWPAGRLSQKAKPGLGAGGGAPVGCGEATLSLHWRHQGGHANRPKRRHGHGGRAVGLSHPGRAFGPQSDLYRFVPGRNFTHFHGLSQDIMSKRPEYAVKSGPSACFLFLWRFIKQR